MPTYCQNPLCEHESLREVRVSVNTPSDETRSLCETCKVAFDWGLQHGRLTAMPQQIWVARGNPQRQRDPCGGRQRQG